MKKHLIFLLPLFTIAFTVNAQVGQKADSTANYFKPKAKSILTELNVNPFKGDISLNNALNQIKLRYFATDLVALRLGFNVNNQHFLTDYNVPYGTNSQHYKDDRSSTTIAINLGVEKHFLGSKRLSPYVGADVILASKSSKQELINGQNTINTKNGWYVNGNPVITEQAYSSLGLNLLTGFDFYVAKNLFFGYEFNLGLDSKTFKTPERTIYGGGSNNPQYTDQKNTSFSFGPSLTNGIRIGYQF